MPHRVWWLWFGHPVVSDMALLKGRRGKGKMRQRFFIRQDRKSRCLRIKEYAVTNKHLQNVSSTMLHDEDFSLLCEESYDDAEIETCIAQGKAALLAALRTPNLFPIGSYANQIAESVMTLYASEDKETIELFFDDNELLVKPLKEEDE
jgi:hypothetical protein